MGWDKGLVRLAGIPLIERVLARLGGLTPVKLITTNNPAAYRYLRIPLVEDLIPGAGAAAGLRTGLANATTELAAVVACDMPFAGRELFSYLLDRIGSHEAAVPVWDGRPQPFHAVYRRIPTLAAVEEALAAGNDQSLVSIIDQIDQLYLSPIEIAPYAEEGLVFFNINSPAELAAAERLLG